MGLNIRPFRQVDQPAARSLILAGLADHFGRLDETLNPDVDDIMASYVSPGGEFAIAEIGGELVATGGLAGEGANVGRIVRMSVGQDHRRKGIGRAMVAHLLEAARRRGYANVHVETNHDWPDAVGLYTSCGFIEYNRDDVSVYLAKS